jgi:stage II sporulation SpoE-like protein
MDSRCRHFGESGYRVDSARAEAAARRRLIGFRAGLYACLRLRGDALFELVEAVLTADGPVACWWSCPRRKRSAAAMGPCNRDERALNLHTHRTGDGSHDIRELPGGPVPGVMPDIDYPAETFTLEENTALVMVTDGVVEVPGLTLDAGLEQTGIPAAQALHDRLNAEATADRILNAAVAWTTLTTWP